MRRHAALLSLALLSLTAPSVLAQERVSSFGEYEGYSVERFDGWETFSQYVEMRDGVRLAVDVTIPSVDGVVTDEPLPLVWTHSRYHRRMMGRPMPELFPGLQRLLRHGYVVASAGVRGSGASFGVYEGLFSEAESDDAAELIDWFAAQPFCDGNVGMYGGSYLGITQYMAASRKTEALKAICPDVAAFDFYDVIYPGGVFRDDMLRHWAGLTEQLDNTIPAARVDADAGGVLLKEAVAQHAGNWDVWDEYSAGPFRDHDVPTLNWERHGPLGSLAGVNEAAVPTYHLNGWFDVFALDTTLWFANFDGPQRVLMGDWSHAQMTRERMRLTTVEQHRWFDRWLKGIENGVDVEPPIRYALMIEPGEITWETAETWPPAGTQPLRLYFAPGPSESVASVNDGRLVQEPPAAAVLERYPVDPTTTTGATSRWDNAVGAAQAMAYPNLARNDEKCLTYTTPVLEEDLVVIGHPVVTLWVTASGGDADLHVLLEEVAPDGVRYVTEGVLRASQRRLAEAPYDNLGLPYQRCGEADGEPVPADEPVEVRMDLHPTATVFDAGHRLRVAIMGADADNTEAPRLEGNVLGVRIGGERGSAIELPVVR